MRNKTDKSSAMKRFKKDAMTKERNKRELMRGKKDQLDDDSDWKKIKRMLEM